MKPPDGPARMELPVTGQRAMTLGGFAGAAVCLVALHGSGHGWAIYPGIVAWAVGCWGAWTDPEPKVRRRMGVLFACLMVLAVCDIQTSTTVGNAIQLGLSFAFVSVFPAWQQRLGDPGVIRFRFWPQRWRWSVDAFYALLSVPLAWAVLKFYWWCNPELYTHWSLPDTVDEGEIRKLFLGINAVGIWDELFFVNTVFAMLRSLFPYRIANAFQAVVYASVLYDMAFTGIGPVILLAFAWTQGSMFERAENLFYVLFVHLVVDWFLVAAIVSSHYPGYELHRLLLHGL